MQTIVDNLAVEYADEGQGPVLLLLHGWGDTLHTWDAIVRGLQGFRIVRLDMPGFGGSEKPHEVWGVVEYARFVESFCKKLQIEPHALVGHSFGGRVIIKGVGVGIFTPQKVILIASAGVAKQRTLKNIALMAAAKVGKAVTLIPPFSLYRQKIRKKLYGSISSDYFAASSMSHIFLKVVKEDLLAYAAKIRLPTLLIWGSDDTQTPLADGEKIRDAIRDSRLEVLNGATHFVHQERAQEVAQLIQGFL